MNRKMQVATLLGATMLTTSVWAQNIDEVIVLSSPFKKAATDVISTTEIITAEQIAGQVNKPIGDVLADLPGVNSAGYGPAVGQPVIRGLGGYRVDVMQNGMSIGDIADTGGDHANALKLFDTERVEVLKGPAALRYGAFAATGVINSFNRHLDANAETNTDILLDFGDNAGETITAFHSRQNVFAISGYAHDADNITIPTHAESDRQLAAEGEEDEDKEQEGDNTQNEGRGFSVSGHFGNDETKLAVMLSSTEMDYGVPGHGHGEGGADTTIDLEQQTVHTRLTHTPSSSMFNSVQADLVISALEQTEFEGVEAHTLFEQDGLHLRVEASSTIGAFQSFYGLEFRDFELGLPEAAHEEGEEEEHFYLPNTERTQTGFFAFAERDSGDWLTELALRIDSVEQKSNHTEEPDENADVSHDLTNMSAGLARKLDGNLLVGGSLSSTERAPSQVELFAEGEHVAARRHEYGDTGLGKESALSSELYVRKGWQNSQLRVAVFQNDYSDFIYRQANNDLTDDDGIAICSEDTPCYEYKKSDAELSGFEIDYQTDIMLGGRIWDASVSYSSVTGELDDGDNLPAIPADKIGFGLGTVFNSVAVQLDVEQVSDQDDTAANELATDGYTKVDISANWQPAQYPGLTLGASVRNLTDEEIRHHTSPLKDLMPEAGQDIRFSARYRF